MRRGITSIYMKGSRSAVIRNSTSLRAVYLGEEAARRNAILLCFFRTARRPRGRDMALTYAIVLLNG